MPSEQSPHPKSRLQVRLSPDYNQRCACGTLLDYSNTHDAEFCRACDRWLAKNCGDPSCEFCGQRPARPSLAVDLDPAPRLPFNLPKLKPSKRRR